MIPTRIRLASGKALSIGRPTAEMRAQTDIDAILPLPKTPHVVHLLQRQGLGSGSELLVVFRRVSHWHHHAGHGPDMWLPRQARQFEVGDGRSRLRGQIQ